MKSDFIKEKGQKTFLKIGNMAIGNGPKTSIVMPVPFSAQPWWAYEKPMPKRKKDS